MLIWRSLLISPSKTDAISDRCPRVIDDSRARKLANDLKRCSYFETCATYGKTLHPNADKTYDLLSFIVNRNFAGLNVERVFQEACQKIVQARILVHPALTPTNSRPTTPTTRLGIASFHHGQQHNVPSPTNGISTGSSPASALTISSLSPSHHHSYSGNNSTLPHRCVSPSIRQRSLISSSTDVLQF